MSENWKPIPGYEGHYEVSDLGRVRSLDRSVISRTGVRMAFPGRILSWNLVGDSGQYAVTLYRASQPKKFKVHRLVLLAFVGPCPEGMVGCHYDDDSFNNRLSNLRWDTQAANVDDRNRNGRSNGLSVTHCPRDHEYDALNTYWKSAGNGRRECRACRREKQREKRSTTRRAA